MYLQFGYALHPKKAPPAFDLLLATRVTKAEPHFGYYVVQFIRERKV